MHEFQYDYNIWFLRMSRRSRKYYIVRQGGGAELCVRQDSGRYLADFCTVERGPRFNLKGLSTGL